MQRGLLLLSSRDFTATSRARYCTFFPQIRQHPFFVDIDWTALANGELSPPWEPTVTGSLDTSQFDHEFTSMPIHSPAAAPNGFLSDAGTFAGFSYSEKNGLAGMGSL